jgi:hypothetical protein
MNSTATQSPTRWIAPGLPSLDQGEQALLADETRYCPTQLLSAFALLMAGHGRAVCTSMMLGDREYALWQLARAHTVNDAQLREIAARLFAYFDDERAAAAVRIRA